MFDQQNVAGELSFNEQFGAIEELPGATGTMVVPRWFHP
jgi:hypothetical protein